MVYDGIQMGEDEGAEEMEEVQMNLRQREDDVSKFSSISLF